MVAAATAQAGRNSDPTWDTRVDLAAAYRLVHRLGMDDSIFTHISARLPDSHDRFLINPYGMRFEEVTAANLVTVDLDGRVVDDPLGIGINPAGFTIHSAIHAARHDVVCVLHTHTVAGVSVSSQRDGLLPINQWSMQFTNRLAYHSYEGIALDLAERERLVADLGERFVLILRNHGLLTCGRSVAESFKLMHNLERSCRAQLALQSAGVPFNDPAPGVPEKTAKQYADFYDAAEDGTRPDIEWAAFKRMLERTDSDYRSS